MEKGYRHEYKYLISKSAAQLLKLRLAGLMERDPHAGPTGQYTIRSLYFDDLHHSAYEEKADGIRDREKFRIRIYNYDTSVIRLEKKEKLGELTRKTGQTITLQDACHFENRLSGPCPDSTGDLTNLFRYKIAGGLRPVVLVDYDRTPFVCSAGQTRITLDENLRTRPYCGSLTASDRAMIPVFGEDQVVLEVKFNDYLPGVLATALEDIPRVNLAISKYVLCLNLI